MKYFMEALVAIVFIMACFLSCNSNRDIINKTIEVCIKQ